MRIGNRTISRRTLTAAGATAVLLAAYGATTLGSTAAAAEDEYESRPARIQVFAPGARDNAGSSGKGWFVDLAINFRTGLAATGFTGDQLTGPAAHANIPPSPGTFSTGQDDRFPGLVVLTSTTNSTRPGFSGPGTNLANLFNLTGITNRSEHETEIWDTWIVGAPIAGSGVDTVLTVAVVADLNGDGIFNDAPNVVTDLNGDGVVDKRDLKRLGVASNIETVAFHINGDPA